MRSAPEVLPSTGRPSMRVNIQGPQFPSVRRRAGITGLPEGREADEGGADSTNQQFGLRFSQDLQPRPLAALYGKARQIFVAENARVRRAPGRHMKLGDATAVLG